MSDENANKTTRPWMPLAVLGGVLVLLVVLALVTYLPALSLWLPSLVLR